MVRATCRRPATTLALLLLLLAWPAMAHAASTPSMANGVALQQGSEYPVLELEAGNGDVTVWAYYPDTAVWRPLALPQEVDVSQLAGATVRREELIPTVVSAGGDALMVYDAGGLRPVERGRVRLASGEWLQWVGFGWEAAGPPAGAGDPLSAAIQKYLNEQMGPMNIHYAVALAPPGGDPAIASIDERRYAFAHALLPAEEEAQVVPLLAELGEDDQPLSVSLLAYHFGWRSSSSNYYRVRQQFRAFTYDVETNRVAVQDPILRWMQGQDFELFHEGAWTPFISREEWLSGPLSRVLGHRLAADETDLGRASLVSTGTVNAVMRPDARVWLNAAAEETGQPSAECAAASVNWQELRTEHFALVYAPQNASLGLDFFHAFRDIVQEDYERFTRLFDAALPLPLTIRLYPDRHAYHCLNPRAQPISPARFHSHVGRREIALIVANVESSDESWVQEATNGLRYEMATLFVEHVTDGKAPPGLQAGVGIYAQEPQHTMGEGEGAAAGSERRASWRFLWENGAAARNGVVGLHAATTVAYLVDAYGWPTLRQYLHRLPEAEGYRQGLSDVYGVDLSAMEEQWHGYFPAFFDGRWRANVLYEFDFDPFEQLLAAGAYVDAAEALKEAVAFLESIDEAEKVAYAQTLIERARLGQEAGLLLGQARQALQAGEYRGAIDLAGEAEALYLEAGDRRRLQELTLYRSRAQEVLELHTTLDQLQSRAPEDGGAGHTAQLQQIGQRFRELGDDEGVTRAEALLEEAEARQEDRLLATLTRLVLLFAGLLLLRLLLVLWKPPPEARLL